MSQAMNAPILPFFEVPPTAATRPSADDLAAAFAARVQRAVELVQAGAVEPLGGGRYKVRSGGGGYWAVRPGYCNCPDFAWRGLVPCKHLLAVELARPLLAARSDAA